ncbi:hypothetical protein [Sphingobacterium sp.]|uniref:hypothetical protein n=1 Tax=Sphingobacterium sp. TaxID=341027 RepID=UPI0031D9FCA3
MKRTAILIFWSLPFAIIAQVILPQSYLKRPMKQIYTKSKGWKEGDKPIYDNTFHWWPTIKNLDNFKENGTRFLQNNVISYSDSLSNVALYSEIASDYIGPVRVSAGLTFAYPKTDTSAVKQQHINRESFLQKLSTGGGSMVLNFTLPIYTFNSQIFGTTLSTGPKFSFDPPAFGVSNKKFITNFSMGTDLQAELRGIEEIFKFTGALRMSYVGGNSSFYNALEFLGNDRKGFWLNNYTIGLNVKEKFTISYTKFWGSKSIMDKLTAYLTFTVSPDFN